MQLHPRYIPTHDLLEKCLLQLDLNTTQLEANTACILISAREKANRDLIWLAVFHRVLTDSLKAINQRGVGGCLSKRKGWTAHIMREHVWFLCYVLLTETRPKPSLHRTDWFRLPITKLNIFFFHYISLTRLLQVWITQGFRLHSHTLCYCLQQPNLAHNNSGSISFILQPSINF